MRLALAAIASALLAIPAHADAPLIVIEQSQIPFDLGPAHPANKPSRMSNSPNSAWNSAANSANSSSAYENRPSNPANSERLIITGDGGVMGFYSRNAGGVLNLFDVNGRRIAYRPAKGTRSLFTTDGQWCGTVDGVRGGGFVLGVTRSCAARFNR
ncbi:hypothetical protein CUV01_11355 [Paracoccus tegillarcae]|uniref:Uncharacterized protein n=2 Tax=Paracoccus tegillarcae TaxID=1529068 RepID=A0A2K9EG32_9RHOB|nr:hypothetical protein CUV01_11355 [Paracoccus tegillarcae]